jgi:uncharacterized protein (TIGR02246 family)
MCVKISRVRSLIVLGVVLGAIFLLVPTSSAQMQNRQSTEARLRVLEDRKAIRRLLIDYGRTLDRRDFVAFSRLFAEGAEYVGGAGSAIKGPSAIAKSLEETFKKNPTGVPDPNFHLFANETIQVNGDEATAVSKGLFVVPNAANAPEIIMMATYEDVLTREGQQWKFKRRSVHADIPALAPKK